MQPYCLEPCRCHRCVDSSCWLPIPPGYPYPNPHQVVNYPSPDVPFTRIVEYKHVPNQSEAVKVRSKYSHPY